MDDKNLTNQSLHNKLDQLIGHFVDFQKTLESQDQKQRALNEKLVELPTQFEKEESFSREPQNETQTVGLSTVQKAKLSDSDINSIPGLSDIIKEFRFRLIWLDQKTNLIQKNLFGTCGDVTSSSISENLRGLEIEIGQVNTSITSLAGRLETVETSLATVVRNIESVETSLKDGHKNVKEDLKKSMAKVVQKIKSAKTSLTDGHKTVKEDLKKSMAKVVQKIDSVETSLNDGHKTVKKDLEKSMATVVQKIDSVEKSLNNGHKIVKEDLEKNLTTVVQKIESVEISLNNGHITLKEELRSLEQRQDLVKTKKEQSTNEKSEGVDSIDLLLIGNSRNGKSATGSTILGGAEFKKTAPSSVASANSCISILKGCTQIGDQIVNVIDGPSIDDNGNIKPEDLDEISEAVLKSLEFCDFGFTSLLIPMKFGNRYTKQEAEAIRIIKSLLGKNVIRDYGVCVITYGDHFENAIEEAEKDGVIWTFKSWLNDQTGEVKHLFEECSYRCVLFNNMAKDKEKRNDQIKKLLEMLPKGKRYSKKEFLEAGEIQQELNMESNLPMLLKQVQKNVEEIKIKIKQTEEGEDYQLQLVKLASELDEQKQIVENITISSPDVQGVMLLITTLEKEIKLKIKEFITHNTKRAQGGIHGKTQVGTTMSYHETSFGNQLPSSPTAGLEDQKLLDAFKADLENYEKISDGSILRNVMILLKDKLQMFHEQVKNRDPDSECVTHLLVEITQLNYKIHAKIKEKEKSSSKPRTTQPQNGKNNKQLNKESRFAVRSREHESGASAHFVAEGQQISEFNINESAIEQINQSGGSVATILRNRLGKHYKN